jgi:hypothetical protein
VRSSAATASRTASSSALTASRRSSTMSRNDISFAPYEFDGKIEVVVPLSMVYKLTKSNQVMVLLLKCFYTVE